MASYNSDDDEGDALFDAFGHDTVATVPLDTTQTQTQAVYQPSPYQTQPTQLLRPSTPNRVQVQASSPFTSPPGRYAGSDRTREHSVVPKPAHNVSSPSTSISSQRAGTPVQRSALSRGLLGRAMAPPGTTFNPTMSSGASQSSRSQMVECNFSDEEAGAIVHDSDEEKAWEGMTSSIKRTTFVRNGVPIDQTGDLPKPRFDQFSYKGPPTIPPKRSADTMANAYGERRRKIPRQAERSDVSSAPEKPMKIDDIKDIDIQRKLRNMQNVYPHSTVRQCYAALLKRHFSYPDALETLSQELEQLEDSVLANQLSQDPDNPVKSTIDLTGSDEETQLQSAIRSLNPVKRNVLNSKSIQEKWGAKQGIESTKSLVGRKQATVKDESQSQYEPPKKRKLIRPKQRASPSRSSPPVESVKSNDTDDDKNRIVDLSSDSEILEVSPSSMSGPERKLIEFLNKCSISELGELSAQPEEVISQVLDERPFSDLDAVRAIKVEQKSVTKTGKPRSFMKKVGDRLVDVCLEVFESYKIVDELVAQCEDLGRPIHEEMRKYGFNAHGQGELELTDLDHDSGIGTPTSSISGDREEKTVPTRRSTQKLNQPDIMNQNLPMKDYQVTGLNWLARLYSHGMSGILADDMGLGKTCQVISFLAHLYESGKSTGPHLIVVPGSTLENWLREFQTFCPTLICVPYYGSQKERYELQHSIPDRDDINVIVTTYEMATGQRDDTKFLRRLEPVVCVYDEGHALKNSQSKRYQALMRIPADFRLLLTGTPLQNNLQELISLLAFIMPNVFNDHDEDLSLLFKHKAKTTDDSGRAALLSKQRIDRARAMMAPFILRRKKEQVLKHLPQKIKRVEYCDLTPAQASMYAKQTEGLREALLARDTGASQKMSSNIMMHLRKAAIHPLLFRHHFNDETLTKIAKAYMQIADDGNKVEEIVYEDLTVMTDFELNRMCDQYPRKMAKFKFANQTYLDSGKTQRLVELLHEHKRNGDRTLVFSQFTMVMDVLEKVFELEEIAYSRIDGSTKMDERQDLIDQYHHDKDILVFMLSTKSGGAGINLTAANKVIIFDQDFNPQTSLQAENRAHRVGQTREVEVVRLISKGTIEEQIHALGDTKLALDQRVAGEGEADPKSMQKMESEGIKMVQEMLVKSMDKKDKPDIKDEFAEGLRNAGLDISDTK